MESASGIDRRVKVLDALASREWMSVSALRSAGIELRDPYLTYTLVQLLGLGRVRVKKVCKSRLLWKRVY